MNDIDKLISQMEREAASTSGMNLSSYEVEASFEVENYLVQSYGMDQNKARMTAMNAAKNPVAMQRLRTAARANQGQGAVRVGGQGIGKSAAQFGVKVTRMTANIAQPLPFVLFGSAELESGYTRLINPILPAGVALTSVDAGPVNGAIANAQRIDLTYTQAANVDIVRIESSTAPWPVIVKSTMTDILKISNLRYSISDATRLQQFDNDLNFTVTSMFGKSDSNPVNVQAYKSPDQFQASIIQIDGEFDIDKETSIVSQIINVAGFSASLNMFVAKFYRQNSKGF